jgi:hypothetical protein
MANTTESINGALPVDKKTEVKSTPINKYSIYEMKAAIDAKIIEYLERKEFTEHHIYCNLKILVGSFCLVFTALAYFYPKPFPENYNMVLFSLIM